MTARPSSRRGCTATRRGGARPSAGSGGRTAAPLSRTPTPSTSYSRQRSTAFPEAVAILGSRRRRLCATWTTPRRSITSTLPPTPRPLSAASSGLSGGSRWPRPPTAIGSTSTARGGCTRAWCRTSSKMLTASTPTSSVRRSSTFASRAALRPTASASWRAARRTPSAGSGGRSAVSKAPCASGHKDRRSTGSSRAASSTKWRPRGTCGTWRRTC
mmetsp:Transcript_140198/g.436021  ORF Transcript_140198/g.436021 Transcript_140198/m.436021 type:complete len:215 (-) Transcript_140198:578-1222(-)